MIHVRLTDTTIDDRELAQMVRDPDCGAVISFLGTVRERTGDIVTTAIDYEAYPEMARHTLERLALEAQTTFGITHVAIVHRLGHLTVGEASIAIAMASPHRAQAFQAVAWLMDSVKQLVPIWKRETDASGHSDWVHPGIESV